MLLTETARRLYDETTRMTIIDAHEHLPPEKEYIGKKYSGLNFFAGYIWHDLSSAGLSEEFKKTMRDPGYRPVSDWWPQIAPYWEAVKDGGYARAARITARDLYGIEDINDHTIERLAQCIIDDNRPGLYKRILGERCGVRTVLSCVQQTDYDETPVFRVVHWLETWGSSPEEFEALGSGEGICVSDLHSLAAAHAVQMRRLTRTGMVVGFKSASVCRSSPDRSAAEEAFRSIVSGKGGDLKVLNDYMFDQAMGTARELDVPVALHAGIWGDFRTTDPKHTIRLAQTYPEVRFDLFHLGMPMARDAVVVGKNFPNVTLNLCWCPVLSQSMTARTLD